MSQKVKALLGAAASLLLVIVAFFVLSRTLANLDLSELRSGIAATSFGQIALGLLFTAFSYLMLTGYDAIALKQLRLTVPYKTTALGSFTSYAVSFTLGFPIFTGGTVRYWIYSRAGVKPGKIASLTVVAGVTFWLGMAVVIGFGLLLEAEINLGNQPVRRLAERVDRLWPWWAPSAITSTGCRCSRAAPNCRGFCSNCRASA